MATTLDAYDIRHVRPSDLPTIRDLHVCAFGGRPNEAVLVGLLHAAGKARPSLAAIDRSTDQVVGHVVFSPMTIDSAPNDRPNVTAVGLGPLAVLREHRRRGVGSRLVRQGIDACRENGFDLVAVLGDPRFYSRFGFESALKWGITNEYVQDDDFMVMELRPGVLAGIRGMLKYAPEFRAAAL
jgi:putative acetyltransferase